MQRIDREAIISYKKYLTEDEKGVATVEKYIRDVCGFAKWICGRAVEKAEVIEYKKQLSQKYAPASVNSILSALNSFFVFCGRYDCKVKTVKIQRDIFAKSEKELTKDEYERLLKAALSKSNQRMYLLMQTICSSGIRVSELRYITVESAKSGKANINCKGKMRTVFLPRALCIKLLSYAKKHKITSGSIFISKNQKPLDRSNIWAEMKKLCKEAGVERGKVFPHNLRHLFARTYYSMQKDIVHLADILGHSNINTTRIYTMESGEVHKRQIEKLGLIFSPKIE